MGGHAIKVVGFGTDKNSGQGYWIGANSWGTTWGLDGFFNIFDNQTSFGYSCGSCIPDLDTLITE